MRCLACDRNLNDYESTRKSITTGKYLDLCNACYRSVKDDIVAMSRPDLEDVIDEIEVNRNIDNPFEDNYVDPADIDLIRNHYNDGDY